MASSDIEPAPGAAWDNLHDLLLRSWSRGLDTRNFAPTARTTVGLETLTAGTAYSWDGLNRGGDPAQPYLILQITLSGSGIYYAHGETRTLSAGSAFAAIVPGPHRYYLPPGPAAGGSKSAWCFFWVLVRHPYIAARIAERQAQHEMAASVLTLAPDAPLIGVAVRLFTGEWADALSEEQAAFDLLFRYERQVQALVSPPAPHRDALLADLRRFTLHNLSRSVLARGRRRRHRSQQPLLVA